MTKKIRIVLLVIPTLVISTLVATGFVIPTWKAHAESPLGGFSSMLSNGQGKSVSRANAALSAAVTSGTAAGSVFAGGMVGGFIGKTQDVYAYNARFNAADGSFLHVHATFIRKASSDYNIDLILTTSTRFTLMHATGTVIGAANTGCKEYAGRFTLYSGDRSNKRVGYGSFSFLFVDLSSTTQGLSFDGIVMHGKDRGAVYHGAMALNTSTMNGNINLYDGTIIPFSAHIDSSNGITFTAAGKLVATGVKTSTGYQGTFAGPVSYDDGTWTSTAFKLI